MGRLILTEDDKNDIKLQYQGSVDKKFYDFLKSNIEIESRNVDFSDKPFVVPSSFFPSCFEPFSGVQSLCFLSHFYITEVYISFKSFWF